jgi:autotransporter-associated beta strand protein
VSLSGGTLAFQTVPSVSFNNITATDTSSIAAGVPILLRGGQVSVNDSAVLTVNAATSAATAGLTKTGAGILVLTNANTYTGATTASAGTLRVTGSIASTSVTVAPSAVLDLANTAGTALAAVTPASVSNDGTMNVNSLSEQAGAISGLGSTSVNGSLTATSIVQNTLSIGAGGSVTIREIPLVAGSANAVPEPSTLALLIAGAAGLLVFARRRRAG